MQIKKRTISIAEVLIISTKDKMLLMGFFPYRVILKNDDWQLTGIYGRYQYGKG